MLRTAYIGIGSNLGDRAANIRAALERLTSLAADGNVMTAPAIETDPVNCPAGSPDFLNTVCSFRTDLTATDLMRALLDIEHQLGRERSGGRNQPRIIDLDLLLLDDLVFSDDCVTVPHPRMHERLFVLKPLAHIAPELLHPVLKKTAACLLAELEAAPVVKA